METGNQNLISPLLEKKGSCTHFLYWGGGGKNPQKVAEKSGLHVVPLRLVGLSVSGAEKTATLLSRIIMGRCALALPLIICAPVIQPQPTSSLNPGGSTPSCGYVSLTFCDLFDALKLVDVKQKHIQSLCSSCCLFLNRLPIGRLFKDSVNSVGLLWMMWM